MYKRIILAVDLAEPSSAPKGLAQALELAKMGGGDLRLVNVQPVVPATFMEYVPADFDAEQSKRGERGAGRHSGERRSAGRPQERGRPRRRHLPRAAAGGDGLERRPHRRRLSSPGDERLSARLEREDDRAPRAMFGAGRQAVAGRPRVRPQAASARIAASTPSGVSGNMRR